jgi:two-component system sensor histidine kinase KdpD
MDGFVRRQPAGWHGYAVTVATTAGATAVCFALRPFLVPANLVMVYLLGITFVASRYGSREAVLATVLGVAAFDFFFVPPYYTFSVEDTQYLLTFGVMLVVALLISGLALKLRTQAELWRSREHRSSVLYRLSRDLAQTRSTSEIAEIAAQEIADVLGGEVAILLGEETETAAFVDRSAVETVLQAGERTERGGALYVPLSAGRGMVGVLAIQPANPLTEQQENLLETFANGLGVAIERTMLAKESQAARLVAESEKMRNVLLNSVSHDLRTPLTVIAGAASALAAGSGDSKELASTIVAQTERMNRHVQNLLDMTRLEAMAVNPNLEWHSVEELVGSALKETEHLLAGRNVLTFVPPSLALVKVDGMLVEKALVNLLENAARHTPAGKDVEIRVSLPTGRVRIQIADRGEGIKPGEEVKIFEKFYQPGGTAADRGFGLGLAICKAVAGAHGGRVWAENRSGGGARFFLELSCVGEAPVVPCE